MSFQYLVEMTLLPKGALPFTPTFDSDFRYLHALKIIGGGDLTSKSGSHVVSVRSGKIP